MAPCKLCRYVMPNGRTCKSPAMRGAAFCYSHGRASRPMRPGRPSDLRMELPHLLDAESALEAINQVVQALGENRISSRRASALLFGIQMSLTTQSAAALPTDPLLDPHVDPHVDPAQFPSCLESVLPTNGGPPS